MIRTVLASALLLTAASAVMASATRDRSSQAVVYVHGRKVGPPFMFAFVSQDTLLLNGVPIFPAQPEFRVISAPPGGLDIETSATCSEHDDVESVGGPDVTRTYRWFCGAIHLGRFILYGADYRIARMQEPSAEMLREAEEGGEMAALSGLCPSFVADRHRYLASRDVGDR